ncbi:uncharacterized protein EDB91DRAFT_1089266 [Suillus paluster]|uniref:uncharacterized protein n=1 Tax=Suillus paluster TaxID=48578 RepID=UPI001B87364F|nr:uncharacterized protein EDB91DRAFT_1089266 [Suillus paluster]KAG1719561.1 hypothetical protein EDB91DRAFT_1089266 [Suillus paluster]
MARRSFKTCLLANVFVVLHDLEPTLECTQGEWILKNPPPKDNPMPLQKPLDPGCQFIGKAKMPSLMSWILFYSNGKKKMSPIDDGPSGRDKGDIHGVIAHLIFANHIKYGPAYHHNLEEISLRTRYKKNKSQFTATGTGIVPLDGASAQNLLEKVHVDLPWYSDLDAIWHSNPSMAAKTHLSKPGLDHAGALYSLIRPHGGAGPSMHFGATVGAGSSMSFSTPAQSSLPPSPAYPPGTQPSPNAYPPPSTHLPPTSPTFCSPQ